MYALGMFCAAALQTLNYQQVCKVTGITPIILMRVQFFHRVMITGIQMRTATVSVVFQKAMKLSSAARQQTTVGEMVNLMAVDAQVCSDHDRE